MNAREVQHTSALYIAFGVKQMCALQLFGCYVTLTPVEATYSFDLESGEDFERFFGHMSQAKRRCAKQCVSCPHAAVSYPLLAVWTLCTPSAAGNVSMSGQKPNTLRFPSGSSHGGSADDLQLHVRGDCLAFAVGRRDSHVRPSGVGSVVAVDSRDCGTTARRKRRPSGTAVFLPLLTYSRPALLAAPSRLSLHGCPEHKRK